MLNQSSSLRPAPVVLLLKRAAFLLSISLTLHVAHAQETSTFKEQGKLIRGQENIVPIGNDLFGDKVSLYTGELEFVQTDVSLPGNNKLQVSVGRRLRTGRDPLNSMLFGQWDLEIPHLHGVFSSKGWFAGNGSDRNLRCTNFGQPEGVSSSQGIWTPQEFWHGNYMYIPGHGDQEMLARDARYTQQPAGGTYPVVTRNNWAIRCLPTLANGSGEGFVAVSPDGTEYRFDWMVSRALPHLTKSNYGSQPAEPVSAMVSAVVDDDAPPGGPDPVPDTYPGGYMVRAEVWILPTLITDRFGNTVTYTYDPVNKWQLRTITAADGGGTARTITLNYLTPGSTASNRVTSVTDGTRTWTYNYPGADTDPVHSLLSSVTLPDSSTWQLAGIYALQKNIEYLGEGGCEEPGNLFLESLNGHMVHPSGARGDFTIASTRHGLAGVEASCGSTDPDYGTQTPYWPKAFDNFALRTKTLSGPGIGTQQWTTDYSTAVPSWAPCNGCVSTKTVEITDPIGSKVRHTYGTLFRETEGQLLQTDIVDSDGSLLRSTSMRYLRIKTDAQGLADRYGFSQQSRGNGEFSAKVIENDRRTISQQGVNFVWEGSGYNVFAQPSQVIRSSSLGPSRTETNAYNNNLGKWILGQVEKVTEASTGKVMVHNVYSPTTANLESVSRFGRVEHHMTYHADGTLATRLDPLGQGNTFNDYRRGIAQTVGYKTSASSTVTETAIVSNIGTVTALTSRAGFTSNFGYDAMGRLASITHPTADTVAWNTTQLSFTPAASSAFDLPAGHWQRRIDTGSGHTVQYFDALWRQVYTERWDDADVAGTKRIVQHKYDANGRKTFDAYPKRSYAELRDGVTTNFDALGRPTGTMINTELGDKWTTVTYDVGFLKAVTDARGNSTTTGYQVFDEPSEQAPISIAAPEGVNVAIARDLFGKTTAITRSGAGFSATRSYVYDIYQRLCKTIEPETGATVQDYDGANNVAWRSSGLALPSTTNCDALHPATASRISFGYDWLNRLLSTTYSDGTPSITRTYTNDGLPLTIASDGATWTNTYNKRRLHERESLAYGGSTYDIERAYDANGSLAQLKYPDGAAITYNPNALGEARQIGTYATLLTYHPNGALASFRYGNGINHTTSQNVRGLPYQSVDGVILNDRYDYDANANVTGITDQLAGSVSSRTMGYDNLDRLLNSSAPGMWGNATYTYDTLDNLRTTAITAGGTARSTVHNFDPATNRLTSISGPAAYNFSYLYDALGNITQRGAQAYVFNQGNRMTSATGKATYRYDGLGHRVSVVGNDGVNRVQVYSQEGQLLYMRGTGVPLTAGTKYIYLNRHQIAEVKAPGAN